MKKYLKIMFLMGIIAFLSFSIFISNNIDEIDYNSKHRLENSGFWDLTGTPIYIDGSDPNFNWSKTANDNDWCSGSGTWNDPYVIENVTINGQLIDHCIEIKNSNVYFIIRNCTLYNTPWNKKAISLNSVSNGTIIKNTCSDNDGHGIELWMGYNNTILENEINRNYFGIALYDSHNNLITKNDVNYNNRLNSSGRGIYLWESDNNTISLNNLITNYIAGLILEGSKNNTVQNNYIYNNGRGVSISKYQPSGRTSDNNTFSENIIKNSTQSAGISIWDDCKYNMIYNNQFINNTYIANGHDSGLDNQWDNGTIGNYWSDYNGTDINDDGIGDSVYSVYNYSGPAKAQDHFPIWDDGHNGSKIIIDNSASNNWNWAKTRSWCSGSGTFNDPYIIKDCLIDGNNSGNCILIKNSDVFFRLENCQVFNCGIGEYNAGIKFEYVSKGTITNCYSSNNNANGIVLWYSPNCSISNSVTDSNSNKGIRLYETDYTSLTKNNCSDNFDGIYLDYMCNYVNITGNTVTKSRAGIDLESWSDYCNISNNIVYNNSQDGIILRGICNYNTISENYVYNNIYSGIMIQNDSNNNTITDNNVLDNYWFGIHVYGQSRDNIFKNNNISYNFGDGICIEESNYNYMKKNVLINNTGHGINVFSNFGGEGHDNTIEGNEISYNQDRGVSINSYCFDNYIFLNNFIGNTISAQDEGTNNQWDNGTIGNYWDDYTGTDLDDNGIGDSVYNISGSVGAKDYYPIWDDGFNGNSLVIDGAATGVGAHNWTWASSKPWCSGSGTFADPFIIKDQIINGVNLSSCIEIRNSVVYFRIENCIVFNSSSGLDNAGIELTNVINGQLVNNNCSNNNGNGIRLSNSQTNLISENIANNNDEFGIFLSVSHSNNLSGNTLTENYGGIYLGLSNNNSISENSAINNDQRGIYLSSLSNNNTILNNNFTYNNQDGIFISDSHNNTVIGNIADHNYNGIWVWKSNNSIIIGNAVRNNDFIGLWLYRSNNTDVIGNTFIGNLYKNIEESESENNVFKWNYLDGVFSPFIIDNDGGGDFTWIEAKSLFFWCTGSGNYSDPYIIQNLIIDGQNSSSCIEIRDSTVFFKIEGCTLSNSGSGVYNAGIKFNDVINGQLIDNNCSNNNGVGIGLYQSQNVTIDGNIVNNNEESGIFLEVSHKNILSGNTLNENSNGMYLGLSNNNTISENSAFNNDFRGIYLSSSSNNNTIMNNNVTYNGDNGIDIYDGHDIKVVGNIAENNGWNGIFVWKCIDATVSKNIANYNTFAGLYLWSSNNTMVIGNVFIGNLYSIYESDGENNNFNWNVENGFAMSIIIDDSGTGNFTWVESVNQLAWIYGSGTENDPYIIEFIEIDGHYFGSCMIIRNSNAFFIVRNSTFHNSGSDQHDAGIKLHDVSNGELIFLNCSNNNGNGIVVDSCQDISIKSSSVNHNGLNGILLIDSIYINIMDNVETINYNDEYGIYLIRSHNNEITGNTINNNRVGIYLDQSNSNFIDWNNLMGNGRAIVDNGENNIIGANNVLPSVPSEFPIEILLIILIVGIVVIGVISAVVIIKKRISIPAKKEKEISEKKKAKVRMKLEDKLDLVDTLIRENNFKLAYKNLGKVKDTADMYDFYSIFNRANEKVEICKEREAGISERAIEEGIAPSVKKREERVITPIIGKEAAFKYNLFISYSTSDRDYFQIKKIVREIRKYPKINQVSYWERDSKENIVEFMDKTLELSNTFILFCSETSLKSKAVKDEWQAAFQMRKQGLIKLIPVYEEQEHIPKLLWHLLNVKYTKDNFKGFIENLYKEIIRG